VDFPPIREARIPQTLREDQGPLVIQRFGATEDPSGSPQLLKPIRRRPLLDVSEELQPGLMKKSDRRVGRAQALGRQVGKSRPNGHRQTPEVLMVANAT